MIRSGLPERKSTLRRAPRDLLAFLLLLPVVGWIACGPSMDDKAPADLVGVWETTEPRYKGCSLEITPERMIFRNPSSAARENRIRGVEKAMEGAKAFYRIHYEDSEGLEYALSLYHEIAEDHGVLYYKHQPMVKWRKGR